MLTSNQDLNDVLSLKTSYEIFAFLMNDTEFNDKFLSVSG
jgi:hypothetical protein